MYLYIYRYIYLYSAAWKALPGRPRVAPGSSNLSPKDGGLSEVLTQSRQLQSCQISSENFTNMVRPF